LITNILIKPLTEKKEKMPLIKKAHMFIMMANDKVFEDTVTFYKKIGLNPKFHLKDKWAEFELENILIGLCPTEEELPDRRTGIVFEVDDLKKIYEENKDLVTFLAEPVEAPHGIMASVKDSSGNVFDLYQPTPEKVKDLVEKIKAAEQAGQCCGSDCTDCKDCDDCDLDSDCDCCDK
jgi:predicted enzyme related to lactoylglutathione lyase